MLEADASDPTSGEDGDPASPLQVLLSYWDETHDSRPEGRQLIASLLALQREIIQQHRQQDYMRKRQQLLQEHVQQQVQQQLQQSMDQTQQQRAEQLDQATR
ncbi:hypothetical protein [Hydrogenophaga sp.]|uniref:hypothetical protein n=1 Tax=Hydrogenophaga sp. TaxID=1904254 RepID=UPI00273053C5|nr:hypothetical protein [Hydrogenophaga sp.]MDP1686096.1 hypothetical protein [Hydrogenophaga sp.]